MNATTRTPPARRTYSLGVDDVSFSLDAVEHLQGRQQAPPRAGLAAARRPDHHDAVSELQHLQDEASITDQRVRRKKQVHPFC